MNENGSSFKTAPCFFILSPLLLGGIQSCNLHKKRKIPAKSMTGIFMKGNVKKEKKEVIFILYHICRKMSSFTMKLQFFYSFLPPRSAII